MAFSRGFSASLDVMLAFFLLSLLIAYAWPFLFFKTTWVEHESYQNAVLLMDDYYHHCAKDAIPQLAPPSDCDATQFHQKNISFILSPLSETNPVIVDENCFGLKRLVMHHQTIHLLRGVFCS